MITDFITRYEGVFSPKECKDIINEINYYDEHHFLYGDEGDAPHLLDHKAINLSWSHNIPGTNKIAELIIPKFRPCVEDYLKTYSVLGQSKFLVYDCKLKKIPPAGGFHAWHYENSSLLASQRHFAIQLYVNDDFEGGETEFLYQNRREAPKAGDVIIFPCGFTHVHRGNPPIGGIKYLATSWGWIQPDEGDVY